MAIICVGASKGGVGKSTLAVNLAVMGATKNKSVLIVDTDPQGSSMCFRSLRGGEDIKATAHTEPTIHKKIGAYRDQFDLIIIDVGGRDDGVLRSAIAASDLFLLPVLPGQFDLWGATDTIRAFSEVRDFCPTLQGRLVLNQIDPVTRVTQKTMKALRQLGKEMPVLQFGIGRRVAFKASVEKGKGVVESEPKGKAAIEIRYLYNESLKIIAGATK